MMMNDVRIIALFIFLSFLTEGSSRSHEAWESNVSIVSKVDLLKNIRQSFGIEVNDLLIQSRRRKEINSISFLLRFPHYRSLKEVSSAYKEQVTSLETSISIRKIEYDNDYSVFIDADSSSPFLSIKIEKERGWGASKDPYTLFRESYLATRKVTATSLKWVRITPKKDRAFYEKSIVWSTVTKPEEFQILQLNPDLWVYSYTYNDFHEKSKASPKVKSVIYSEKYGLSITLEATSDHETSNLINDNTMLNFTTRLANRVFDEAEEKGIIPSPKYVHFMREKRKKRTGSVELPRFVSNKSIPFVRSKKRGARKQIDLNEERGNTSSDRNGYLETGDAEKVISIQWMIGSLIALLILLAIWRVAKK